MSTKNTSAVAATSITIDGTSYPCYMTMGALLLFKQTTGREMSEMTEPSIEDTVNIIYCIAKACATREGIAFPFSDAVEFACHLTPEQISSISIA